MNLQPDPSRLFLPVTIGGRLLLYGLLIIGALLLDTPTFGQQQPPGQLSPDAFSASPSARKSNCDAALNERNRAAEAQFARDNLRCANTPGDKDCYTRSRNRLDASIKQNEAADGACRVGTQLPAPGNAGPLGQPQSPVVSSPSPPPQPGPVLKPPLKRSPSTPPTWTSPTGETYPAKIFTLGGRQFLFPLYYRGYSGDKWVLDERTIQFLKNNRLLEADAMYFMETMPSMRQMLTGTLVPR